MGELTILSVRILYVSVPMARKIEQIQQENIAIQKELDALKALTEREEKEKKKSEKSLINNPQNFCSGCNSLIACG